MLDHIFLTVADILRSIAFYERTLAPLGIEHAVDYDGKNGPEGHPDLKGFGRDNRVSFWLATPGVSFSICFRLRVTAWPSCCKVVAAFESND